MVSYQVSSRWKTVSTAGISIPGSFSTKSHLQRNSKRASICYLNPSIFLFKFISYRRVRVLTDAPIHFGLIPPEHWYQPEWIDENLARLGRLRMMGQGIIYGGTL